MKKSGYKFIFVIYSALVTFALLMVFIGAMLIFNIITTTDPNGNSVKSNWPQEYTREFSKYFELDGDIPVINQSGIQSLNDNQLWVQILDENGNEVFAHNTTARQAKHYSLIDFLELYQGEDNESETVYVGTVETGAERWTYSIGFPMNISKVTMNLDGNSFAGGKYMILILLSAVLLLMLAGGGMFGVWIVRHMRKMTQAIGYIFYRLYEPIQNGGPFQDVYDSLNDLNCELLASDKALASNDIMREEWITNITHELKTPLSPIKGYAELLANPASTLSNENRIKYGRTILQNTEYAEKLINDLKLTYQLKNNMLPLCKQQASLTRFLRDLIIDILNHPDYSNRKITFFEADNNITFCFDETLLKRAMDNLILNAIIHNPEDTEISVTLRANDRIIIEIADNGKGMNAEEIDNLWRRYYRGTSAETRIEGTGLGMAIAKQIIEIHGGTIDVNSKPGKGTYIVIDFSLAD